MHKIDRKDWPSLIIDMAQVIGEQAALAMLSRFAGRHLHIPKHNSSTGDIEAIIGIDKAKLLYHRYSGCCLSIPNCRGIFLKMRNQEIINDWSLGMAQGDMATKYQLSERRINQIIGKTALTRH